jgi:hypothetical protein
MSDTAFETKRRLSTKECSVEARKILKAAFPDVKFSVRTEHGTAVNVSWTDGPAARAVESKIWHLKAGHFDGMQDMYVYDRDPDVLANEDGTFETVEYGAHYVFVHRTISEEWRREIFATFAEKIGPDSTLHYSGDRYDAGTWSQTVPLWVTSSYGTDEPGELLRMVDSEQNDVRDVFHRYVQNRSR